MSLENKYYYVYNSDGEYIGYIHSKNEKKLTDQYIKGITCFVINNQGKVLLEERANTELTPGKLDLVSGHVDGDEIGIQAAIRELDEEVGIQFQQIQKIQSIARKPMQFEDQGETKNFFIEFYYVLLKNNALAIEKEEVESVRWVDMEEAFKMIKTGETKFPQQSEKSDYEPIFNLVRQEYLNIKNNEKEKGFEK